MLVFQQKLYYYKECNGNNKANETSIENLKYKLKMAYGSVSKACCIEPICKYENCKINFCVDCILFNLATLFD